MGIKERERASEKAELGPWTSEAAGEVRQVQAWACCTDVTITSGRKQERSGNDLDCCLGGMARWMEMQFYLLEMVRGFHLVRKKVQRASGSVALLGLKILKL